MGDISAPSAATEGTPTGTGSSVAPQASPFRRPVPTLPPTDDAATSTETEATEADRADDTVAALIEEDRRQQRIQGDAEYQLEKREAKRLADAKEAERNLARLIPQPYSAMEAQPRLRRLIGDLVPRASLVLMFGPPGCMKSFVAQGMAFSLAAGRREWCGQPIPERASVVYTAAEGARGMGANRAPAWRQVHGVNAEELEGCFYYIPAPVDLNSEATVDFLIKVCRERGIHPGLFVIDTYSRCSGEGEENSNSDAARITNNVGRLIETFDCTVLVIHHSGVDEDRPRGATALNGAADVTVRVKADRDGHVTLQHYKTKDDAPFDDVRLHARVVMLMDDQGRTIIDQDGRPQSSVVLVPDIFAAERRDAPLKLTPPQVQALSILAQHEADGLSVTPLGREMPSLVGQKNLSAAASKICNKLLELGLVEHKAKKWIIARKGLSALDWADREDAEDDTQGR